MDVDRIDAPAASPWLSESAIAESDERYASMFTHHPHAAYSVDPHGYYTAANARALEMTGLSLQQMRRTHFSQVIHPEDVHLIEASFGRALTGLPQVTDARIVRSDGAIIDIRCTAIPVVVGGQVRGVHGISEDITETKEVVRQLEAANAAKTLFLATVSHEVRTPLAVLVGATDLLMASDLGPEPAHFADMVHRSSQRLMDLVNDILDFSGLDAHQTVLHPGPVDVRALVDNVADWAVPLAHSRGLDHSLTVDDSVPAIAVGDGRRITQVVSNLVQNAISYTEEGRVDLHVLTRPDGWIHFIVSDTGAGIAEDDLEALFEPFVQGDPQNARDHRGVGLGLAICRELADLMGGRLVVCSTPGEGSTFTFGVPMGARRDPGPSSAG